MAKLPIILFPDPILRKPRARRAHRRGTARLVDNMLETMYRAPGVGLAAPQVGVSRRIFVMDAARDRNRAAPAHSSSIRRSSSAGDEIRVYEEGCLSIPEMFAEVERPATVLVRYLGP